MEEKTDVKTLVNTIYQAIEDKKGNNITIIKFSPEITSICDYFIIADAESDRQLKAISDWIQRKVKNDLHTRPLHVEGEQFAQWIVLDYLDVIVHLFTPEMRDFYALEQLWADAKFFNKPLN